MVKECSENNWVDGKCTSYFVGACTSVAHANREGCEDFNNAFCGSHEAQSSAPGMSSNIQYCTLAQARSQCASDASVDAPACKWLENIKKSETCKQDPFYSTCLPQFTDFQEFSDICDNYPEDVVCRNNSQGFTVALGINKEADVEERSVADTKTSPELILPSDRAKALQSELQPANVNIFATKSPARQLCGKGELYDCQ